MLQALKKSWGAVANWRPSPTAAERLTAYERMVAELYEKGKALNAGSLFQVDEVIDPAETRRWLIAGLRSLPPAPVREGKRRPCVDGW